MEGGACEGRSLWREDSKQMDALFIPNFSLHPKSEPQPGMDGYAQFRAVVQGTKNSIFCSGMDKIVSEKLLQDGQGGQDLMHTCKGSLLHLSLSF